MSNLDDIRKVFEQVKYFGIEDDSVNISFEEYLETINSSKEELEALLDIKPESTLLLQQITFNKLLLLPYLDASKVIDSVSMPKRLQLLEECKTHRDHIYKQVAKYGNSLLPRDEQLTVRDYHICMSKIKHVEILQNWLYGIK